MGAAQAWMQGRETLPGLQSLGAPAGSLGSALAQGIPGAPQIGLATELAGALALALLSNLGVIAPQDISFWKSNAYAQDRAAKAKYVAGGPRSEAATQGR